MDRWRDRVAIVTGASAGIGAKIAEVLAMEGLKVVGFARRQEKMQQLADEIKAKGGHMVALKCDVTEERQIVEAMQWVKENVGPVSVVVNNAGMANQGYICEQPTSDWMEAIHINMVAPMIATREAFGQMQAAGITDGHIININSVTGHSVIKLPEPNMSVYPATKFALRAINESLRQEFNYFKTKMRVTNISPGLVFSEVVQKMVDAGDKSIMNQPGLNTEDIAQAVKYVLSTPPHVQVDELTIRPVGDTF